MTSAYQRYQTLQEQVDAYGESFREAEVRFNAGAITSLIAATSMGNNVDRLRPLTGLYPSIMF
jgi:outer membrane protein